MALANFVGIIAFIIILMAGGGIVSGILVARTLKTRKASTTKIAAFTSIVCSPFAIGMVMTILMLVSIK